MKWIFCIAMLSASLVFWVWCLISFIRSWRRHQEVMRLLDQCKRISDTFKHAKTEQDLEAKFQRWKEVMEHTEEVQRRR